MADTIKSTASPSVHAQTVVNPDGTNIGDAIPTSGNNPSLVLGYTGENLTTITKTIGATSYVKTLSYSGSTLTGVSAWVEQ